MSLNDGFKSSEKVGNTGYQLAPYMGKVGLQVGRVGLDELTVNRTPWAGTQKGLERIRITWYRDFVFDKISSCGAIGMLLLRIRSIVTRGHRGNSQVARLAGVVKPWPANIRLSLTWQAYDRLSSRIRLPTAMWLLQITVYPSLTWPQDPQQATIIAVSAVTKQYTLVTWPLTLRMRSAARTCCAQQVGGTGRKAVAHTPSVRLSKRLSLLLRNHYENILLCWWLA